MLPIYPKTITNQKLLMDGKNNLSTGHVKKLPLGECIVVILQW